MKPATQTHDEPATQTHDDKVRDQFGPRAAAYVASAVHAQGSDLDRLEEVARAAAPRRALDLGTGGGHAAYRLAPHAAEVVVCDLSEAMTAAVLETGRAKGFANLSARVARAEALPFADGEFDLLTTRFSAHHWGDFEAGLREARRVLAPGGRAVFIDVSAPESEAADTHLQAVELLRDPSHVRDHRPSFWLAALERAGFRTCALSRDSLRLDFASWVARMETPAAQIEAIRALQRGLAAETAARFALEPDGSFTVDRVFIEAE